MDSQDSAEVTLSVVCHVDDLLVAGWSPDTVNLSAHLSQSFQYKCFGGLHLLQWLHFVRDLVKGTLLIHRRSCVEKMVKMFGLENRRKPLLVYLLISDQRK